VGNKIIAFDLDDVLCFRTSEVPSKEKYHTCQPIPEMIKIVNDCYDDGNKVLIYTARGMNVYKKNLQLIESELRELTEKQLSDWGVKYHELIMGKVHYDMLIDDKAISSYNIKDPKDIASAIARNRKNNAR